MLRECHAPEASATGGFDDGGFTLSFGLRLHDGEIMSRCSFDV